MAEKDIIFATEESAGEIKISNEAILIIAAQALCDIKGIHLAVSATEGLVEKLVKKPSQKGIRICLDDEAKKADIDVHISVDYGMNIPEASWTVQEAVKKNVEMMTSILVDQVNVFVDGITIEKEPKLPKVKKIKTESIQEEAVTANEQ